MTAARWLDSPIGRLIPLALFALAWEIVTQFSLVNRALLPSFSETVVAAVDLIGGGQIWEDLYTSLFRALAGWALGVVVGVVIGMAMAWWRPIESFVDPIVTTTYSLPKPALIPLTMLWLGVGTPAAVLVVFLGCLLPVIVNAYHGTQSVSRYLIWSAQAMGTPSWERLFKVALPGALPYIFSGARIALAFSFVLMIAAEQVASRVGIGAEMLAFGQNGVYNYMFATIAIVVIIAYLADVGFVWLMRRVLRWHSETS